VHYGLVASYQTTIRVYYLSRRKIQAEPGSPEELLELFCNDRPALALPEEFVAVVDITILMNVIHKHFGPIAAH
jgi:hypothetical protein